MTVIRQLARSISEVQHSLLQNLQDTLETAVEYTSTIKKAIESTWFRGKIPRVDRYCNSGSQVSPSSDREPPREQGRVVYASSVGVPGAGNH